MAKTINIAIANRGEVAVRVIHACHERGMVTTLLAAKEDLQSLAARLSDDVAHLPGDSLSETYLNQQAVISACQKHHVDALHPGFGFLSENAEFVANLEKAGIGFIGPSAKSMRTLGNKISARKLAAEKKVDLIPAWDQDEGDDEKAFKAAKKFGFPLIIKPSFGGGGKGMKVVHKEDSFLAMLSSARREALSAFGSDHIYLEKYLLNPRHLEVQVFGLPSGEVMHLFERECSIQRRFQKVIEEAPAAPGISEKVKHKAYDAAVKLAKAANYTSAGTMEFLVNNEDVYFMECNTRLQVEHPVTESITDIDLVGWQLELWQTGDVEQKSDLSQRGHSIEVRIYAEDPTNQFLPSTGPVGLIHLPHAPGLRFDFGVESGDEIFGKFDPMIGKVIAFGGTREQARKRLVKAMNELVVFGVDTNIEFLKSVVSSQRFAEGNLTTKFIEDEFPSGFTQQELTQNQTDFANQERSKHYSTGVYKASPFTSPWTKS